MTDENKNIEKTRMQYTFFKKLLGLNPAYGPLIENLYFFNCDFIS